MNTRRFYLFVCVCFGLSTFSFVGGADDAATRSAESVFVCMDPAQPCIGDTAGACPHCSKTLTSKPLSLETLMESLAALAKAMNKDIESGKTDSLSKHAESIVFISGKLAKTPPKKNVEKITDFTKLSNDLAAKANAILVAADSKDAPAMKAGYKNFEALCKSCHSVFR